LKTRFRPRLKVKGDTVPPPAARRRANSALDVRVMLGTLFNSSQYALYVYECTYGMYVYVSV